MKASHSSQISTSAAGLAVSCSTLSSLTAAEITRPRPTRAGGVFASQPFCLTPRGGRYT
jgi:hypothetical protein